MTTYPLKRDTLKQAKSQALSAASLPYLLSALTIPLTVIATMGGLSLPDLYKDPNTVKQAMRGQDLVTLLSMAVLIWSMVATWRGSLRAPLIWIGLLGYMLYTYTGAAFGYAYNPFLLIYIALFSLSLFGVLAVLSRFDVAALRNHFDAGTPRKTVIAYLALIPLIFGIGEIGENIGYLQTGILPKAVANAGGTSFFPYVLDLGLIVPLAILAIVWLWQRKSWGYLLTSYLLTKGATMGLALFVSNRFAVAAGLSADGLDPVYATLALAGLGLLIWFLRHCRPAHQ